MDLNDLSTMLTNIELTEQKKENLTKHNNFNNDSQKQPNLKYSNPPNNNKQIPKQIMEEVMKEKKATTPDQVRRKMTKVSRQQQLDWQKINSWQQMKQWYTNNTPWLESTQINDIMKLHHLEMRDLDLCKVPLKWKWMCSMD